MVASLKNGQKFEGAEQAWYDSRIAVFDWVQGDQRAPITGRAGDIPAVQGLVLEDGLAVMAYQSQPSVVSYPTWEKFQAFVEHKDFGDVRARHLARGLPEAPFREVYTRYSKALVGVGHGRGADRAMGFETEFVALANPYVDDLSDGFPVRLSFDGAPRAAAQVEVFERAPDGAVVISLLRTDAEGVVHVPVTPGHVYLLDAVILRDPAPDLAEARNAVWESLWAALSFAVPG